MAKKRIVKSTANYQQQPMGVMASRARISQGTAVAVLSFVLGGTQTVSVTLERSMLTDDYVALGSIQMQSAGLLGSVSVKEARPVSQTQIDLVLTSSSILSSVTVTVVAVGVGLIPIS